MENNHLQTPWFTDPNPASPAELLNAVHKVIRVVSFDFFDTLVFRLCAEPEDLFVEVGRELARRNQLRLPLSPPEFRAVRRAADKQARKSATRDGASPEVHLARIYDELREVVVDPTAARDLEFNLECRFCRQDPAVAALARQARQLGLKTAVLSDTCFSAAELSQIMQEVGICPSLFDAVLTSCDWQRAKADGSLYHALFQHFDIFPTELLHLGNCPHADYVVAQRFRVRTTHYFTLDPNLLSVFRGERSLRGDSADAAGSLQALRVRVARQSQSAADPFRDGALTFGPLLTRLADWAATRFAAAGVRTVLALMREGELLGELLQQAAASAGVGFQIIPCFASRLSTARAAVTAVEPGNVVDLFEGSAHWTAPAVMAVLGFGDEAPLLIGEEALNQPLTTKDQLRRFLRPFFLLPELRQRIEARFEESRRLAFDYLAGLVGDEQTIGVLDLGWSGSTQHNIARILRRGGRDVRTVGCYLACTPRSGRLALEGDEAHAYLETEWAHRAILLETAVTACCGSTEGYRRDESGQVVPQLGEGAVTPEQRQVKIRLREGILAFQAAWLNLRAPKGPAFLSPEALADIDRHSAAILFRLQEYPTKPEADRLGVLYHDENYFGPERSAALCRRDLEDLLRREGAGRLFREPNCYWPQGVIARVYPRMLSALRPRWSDPAALGRWGRWRLGLSDDPGLTDEEVLALGAVLRSAMPDQVVFCGPLVPALDSVFLNWLGPAAAALSESNDFPPLIIAHAAPAPRLHCETAKFSVFVPDSLGDPATVRAIRAKLTLNGNIALILTEDLPDDALTGVLNALAPFLGDRGIVLVPCGRYDFLAGPTESRPFRAAEEWYKRCGQELGYGPAQPAGPEDGPPVNWVAHRRDSASFLWSRQWMAIPDDVVGFDLPSLEPDAGPGPAPFAAEETR